MRQHGAACIPTQWAVFDGGFGPNPANVWRFATCGIPLETGSRLDLRGGSRSGNADCHPSATSRLHDKISIRVLITVRAGSVGGSNYHPPPTTPPQKLKLL